MTWVSHVETPLLIRPHMHGDARNGQAPALVWQLLVLAWLRSPCNASRQAVPGVTAPWASVDRGEGLMEGT